jgi:PAS domain S-box-containing protein
VRRFLTPFAAHFENAMPSLIPASNPAADVIEHIQDGVFVLDEAARVVFINRAAEKLLQRDRANVLGRNVWEAFPQAIGSRSHQEYERALVEQRAVEFEDFLPRVGRWFEVRVSPIAGRLAISFRDVTERRAMDERLRRSEARFLSLMKATQQAVWVTGPDGSVIEDIPEWRAFTGFTVEQAAGMGWLDAIHPDDRAAISSAWRSALAGKNVFEAQQRLRRHDGVYRCMSVRAIPMRDADGALIEWVGTSTDVTEQREAEQELRESAWLLAETQRLAHVGSASWDLQRGGNSWSEELHRVCGLAIGQEPQTVDALLAHVHPDDRAAVRAAIVDGIAEKRRQITYSMRFIRPDGELRHFETSAEVQFSDDGRPLRLLAAVQDVTDRERAAATQRDLEGKLVKSAKLESLGVLAGGIAHDVNNLLVGILGNASVALTDAPPSLVEPLTEIVTTAQRAGELAHQLLAFSGKGRFAMAPLDLSTMLLDAQALLRTTMARSAALCLDAPPDLPSIEADGAQIRQVVMNLVANASDALDAGGGTVTVRTGAVQATSAQLRSTFVDDQLPEGAYVFIEVSDTGKGMTPETAARMFDPFFTTKRSGHGLGLAATLGIVRGHHGAIRVETEPGKGSRITALFPALRAPAPEAAPPPADSSAPPGGTILVVDDDELVRRVAKRILVKAGYAVVEAEHGKAALAIFEKNRGKFALVLLDLSMPVMGGEETFRALRALDPALPIVLSSGYNEHDPTGHFVGRGLAGFVQKPFVMSDFLEVVRRTMRG